LSTKKEKEEFVLINSQKLKSTKILKDKDILKIVSCVAKGNIYKFKEIKKTIAIDEDGKEFIKDINIYESAVNPKLQLEACKILLDYYKENSNDLNDDKVIILDDIND
jgi:hypothetical protein